MSAKKQYSNLDFGSVLTGINVPAPVNPGDLVPKSYADGIAQGVLYKQEVMAATTAPLAANTYAAGGGGVLTASANGVIANIDGYTPIVGDRILVKNEATGANNGIYLVTSVGAGGAPYVLTRTADAIGGSIVDLIGGSSVYIKNGTVNGGAIYTQNVVAITIGTTAQVWVQSNADVTYPISIANGGTGQTSAANAIGATGLGAQTTPTGGTGVTSVTAAGLTRKTTAQIANPTLVGSPYLITHNLGTQAVVVSVIDLTTFQEIDVAWSADTINTVNVRFDATDANTVLVTIVG